MYWLISLLLSYIIWLHFKLYKENKIHEVLRDKYREHLSKFEEKIKLLNIQLEMLLKPDKQTNEVKEKQVNRQKSLREKIIRENSLSDRIGSKSKDKQDNIEPYAYAPPLPASDIYSIMSSTDDSSDTLSDTLTSSDPAPSFGGGDSGGGGASSDW